MKLLIIFTILFLAVNCNGFRMTSTKCPPISATVKSILTTLPSFVAQIKNDAVTEKVFYFILILLNNS